MDFKFVTKILSFNPTELLNPRLKRQKLLQNKEVQSMIRTAYTWGKNSEVCKLYGEDPSDRYSLSSLLEELRK